MDDKVSDTLTRLHVLQRQKRMNRAQVIETLSLAEEVIYMLCGDTLDTESQNEFLQDQLDMLITCNSKLAGIAASISAAGRYGTA